RREAFVKRDRHGRRLAAKTHNHLHKTAEYDEHGQHSDSEGNGFAWPIFLGALQPKADQALRKDLLQRSRMYFRLGSMKHQVEWIADSTSCIRSTRAARSSS